MNKRTGDIVTPDLMMHLKFFFFYEEKQFGIIVLICIIMGMVLVVFFGYHIGLASSNLTTNETFKKSECERLLYREEAIIKQLIYECEEWTPKSDSPEDKEMP